METIQASEAKTHFLRILNRVEQGETVVITRHGRAIARLSPEATVDRARVRKAVEEMKALRKKIGHLSLEEILSARDEGRS
jgi:prevent-host-death family protein